jgi:glutathione-dependent formaldehyde-activating enzyme
LRGSISIYESSSGVLRGFCRECGTSLTYQKDPSKIAGAQDHVFIATRTLDDPNAFPPDEHVYYSERVEWLNVEDARPHHERLSADYAYLQLATLNQKRWGPRPMIDFSFCNRCIAGDPMLLAGFFLQHIGEEKIKRQLRFNFPKGT